MIERIPSIPPTILPVQVNVSRPLWSVMIPAYNCSRYLEQTLVSVLDQYCGADKMQIEVVDDCSTDADVAAIVAKAGRGIVQYHRKEQNMGSIRNFETCINRATGHLIHILHGDDFVKPGFYQEIETLFEQHPDAGAAFTDFYFVDSLGEVMYTESPIMEQPGILENRMNLIGSKQRIQPPAMVVKRQVYEKLGSFFAVKYGEDWEMWARIAQNYPILHSPKHLACYRIHNDNISTESLATGQNIKDINRVISIIQNYLPDDSKKQLKKTAKKNFSIYYAWMAHKLYHDHKNPKGALIQINGALHLHLNKTTIFLALKLYTKLMIRYKQ